MAIGGVIGAAPLLILFMADWCSDESSCGRTYAAGAAYIGAGLAAGAAIDAVVPKHAVIYRCAEVTISFRPARAPGGIGAGFSVRF